MNSKYRVLLAGVSLVAVSMAAPALGADLPRAYTKAPAMVAPVFSWTGFYIGLHAGYGFGDNDTATTVGLNAANQTAIANGTRPGLVKLDRDGFIGGGQIGYNWQTAAWVWGIEADISYTDIGEGVTIIGATGLANSFNHELEYLGTVRGRLGYTWGTTMIYATGGLAYGGVKTQVAFFNAANAVAFAGSRSETEVGYTVGGGLEHAFSPNWSAKVEYLYYDLGDTALAVPGTAAAPAALAPGFATRFENSGHIVRAGLNYKFGWR